MSLPSRSAEAGAEIKKRSYRGITAIVFGVLLQFNR
jgi:hypothetical protein